MRLKKFTWMIAALMPAMLLAADSPPARDAHPGQSPRFGPRFNRPDDPQEIKKAWDFVQQNSPNRWKSYQEVKDKLDPDRLAQLERTIVRRVGFVNAGTDDVRAVRLKQFKLEDDIFGLRMQMIKVGGTTSPQAEPLKPQLRDKVQALVEARIDERSLRLKHLQEMLKSETDRLDEDRANKATLVTRQFEIELNNENTDPIIERPRRDLRDRPNAEKQQ